MDGRIPKGFCNQGRHWVRVAKEHILMLSMILQSSKRIGGPLVAESGGQRKDGADFIIGYMYVRSMYPYELDLPIMYFVLRRETVSKGPGRQSSHGSPLAKRFIRSSRPGQPRIKAEEKRKKVPGRMQREGKGGGGVWCDGVRARGW